MRKPEADGRGSVDVFVQIILDRTRMDCVRRFEEAVLRRNDVLECLLLSSDMNYWLRLRLACLTDFETIRADLLADLPGVQDMMASFVICDVLRRRDTPT
ncbi:hypothetical protein GCM10023219_19020 [Stakelama sediminis]|uniref:DNA-binding Lrp family transcriptional regulator n=1 Tax=Stakelama sediminis TaxID=463200 RepID=A0A840Z1Y9_9SPHN|nr:DNA-binding Lrp family transcriptional regulator [Stakelama sediminis]